MPMEPEVSRFLKRIVKSLSLALLWLIINLSLGIYAGWMVPEHGIGIGNIIFYLWMAGSFAGLLWLLSRMWKEKLPHD